jgi:hypothetical protein
MAMYNVCRASRTISGLLLSVAAWVSVGRCNRLLISLAWFLEELTNTNYFYICAKVEPRAAIVHATQCLQCPRRQGRPTPTLVTR